MLEPTDCRRKCCYWVWVIPNCDLGLEEGFENPLVALIPPPYLKDSFWPGFFCFFCMLLLAIAFEVVITRDLFISFMKVLKSYFLSSLFKITLLLFAILVEPLTARWLEAALLWKVFKGVVSLSPEDCFCMTDWGIFVCWFENGPPPPMTIYYLVLPVKFFLSDFDYPTFFLDCLLSFVTTF